MKTPTKRDSIIVILSPLLQVALIFVAFGSGRVWGEDAMSGDAYARFDKSTNTWSLGTPMVEEKLHFANGTYTISGFENKLTHSQYAGGADPSDEFRLTVNGKAYSGTSGGWTWKGADATVPAKGEVQLTVRVENDLLRVEKTYVVYAGTSVIRQSLTYQNIGSRPIKVSDPYFLAHRLRADETNKLTLHYMTGGGYFTGSQILKDVPLSATFARTFDSTDKAERVEISEVSYGYPMPWGSGAYMQWFCLEGKSNGGLFIGFDYYGRWAADIGNYFGKPGYLGLRVAGYEKELAPGESLLTPKAFTGVFAGDLDSMGNQLKGWQYRYLWDYKNADYFGKTRYAAEMRWQYGKGTVPVGGGTEDNWDYRMASLLHASEVMRSVGADVLWQDAGWHDHLGDNDGPDFLQTKQYLKKSGMELAVWWPLYSVSTSSRVYRQHPEWAADTSALAYSNLDTSKKEVIDYMLEQLDQKVATWGDFQWRLDGTAVVPINKNETPMLSEFHNVMSLLTQFRQRHPHSSIDICSGGGNLMGFETLRMSDVSQLTDAGSLYNANYYSSYLFPPDVIDDWTRDDNFTWEQARSALTMAPAWMSDRGLYGHEPGLLLNDGLENLRRTFEIYHYLVQQGVAGRWSLVYHPIVKGDDPVYYFERLSQDEKRGVIILKHFPTGEIKVFPKGLKRQESYDVRFAVSRSVSMVTGADLMEKGITLLDPEPGELIFFGLPNYPGSGADHTPPSDPTDVQKKVGANMGVTGVEIEWQPSTDNNWISYYQIYRDGKMIDKVAKGTYYFDHSSGAENIVADYSVQAVDGDGNASGKIEALKEEGGPIIYTAQGSFLAGKDYSYQGANRWSYEEWTGPSHKAMAWNGALGQMGLYQGSAGEGPDKAMIGASWMRPGESADAVRVFALPYTGKVTITGEIHKDLYHTYGDGVRIKVLKDEEQVWPQSGWQSVGAQDVIGKTMKISLSVRKGEKLYFVVNPNGDSKDDDTVWNPQVVYDQIDDRLKKTEWHITDDDSSRLQYSGQGWQRLGRNPWSSDVDKGYLAGWLNGTLSVSATPGDKLEVRFRGTGVDIIGQTGSDRGIASITLDGKEPATIDTFTPQQIVTLSPAQAQIREAAQWATSPPTLLWGVQDLADGDHVLELTVTGKKNDKSTGTNVGIDAIVVSNGSILVPPDKESGRP